MSANQLIILETLAQNLCPATKTLILDANGKPNVINYGRAIKFHGQIYQPTNIDELSHLLEFYADIPYALVVRGQFRDHVDLTKPIWRRKDERKYPKAPATICLMETALNWLMLDIDKLSLPALGFNAPLSQLDPQTVCDAIIAKHLPELQGITYHFQLSSTAGWFNPHTISVHLWLWLDKPMTNPECKAFAKMVNARENQQILDPSLYNAAQPHYIANPILGNGVETDPLPVRSGLVKKEKLIYHNIEITRNAKHVICVQSLVSDLTLSFLKLAGRDDVIKVINTYQPWKSLPIDFFRKKDKALERLLEIAEKGTPFLCPCNSSGQALRMRHPDKNYLLVTNDRASEPEQSAFLSDSNKHAHKSMPV